MVGTSRAETPTSKYQCGTTASEAGRAAYKPLTASNATSAGQRGSVSSGDGSLLKCSGVSVRSFIFAGTTWRKTRQIGTKNGLASGNPCPAAERAAHPDDVPRPLQQPMIVADHCSPEKPSCIAGFSAMPGRQHPHLHIRLRPLLFQQQFFDPS